MAIELLHFARLGAELIGLKLEFLHRVESRCAMVIVEQFKALVEKRVELFCVWANSPA